MFASLVICESSELSLSLTVMLCVLISRVPVCLSVVEVKNFKIDLGFLRSYFLHLNLSILVPPKGQKSLILVAGWSHMFTAVKRTTRTHLTLQRKKLHFNRKT